MLDLELDVHAKTCCQLQDRVLFAVITDNGRNSNVSVSWKLSIP